MTERWKVISGGRYEVSDFGTVRLIKQYRNKPAGFILSGFDKYGYPRVYLGPEIKHVKVHALVAAAFIGERPIGMEVNHRDGNKKNNHWTNLEYVTHQQNMSHAGRIGLLGGEGYGPTPKLTKKIVEEIRRLHANGVSSKRLGIFYGVHRGHVWRLVRRMNWKNRMEGRVTATKVTA